MNNFDKAIKEFKSEYGYIPAKAVASTETIKEELGLNLKHEEEIEYNSLRLTALEYPDLNVMFNFDKEIRGGVIRFQTTTPHIQISYGLRFL